MISRETLEFFRDLLGQVSLPAAADNFEVQAERIIKVRRELKAELGDNAAPVSGAKAVA